MIKLIMLLIFVTWCYLPFLTIWCRANEHPRMFLCQVYIYRHVFSISWHSNVNVKMLFRPIFMILAEFLVATLANIFCVIVFGI